MLRVAICLALVAACSSKVEPPAPVAAVVPHDAAEIAPEPEPEADPLSGVPIGRAPGRPAVRVARPIDVILRSSPSGAAVAVDGVQVGTTPTYWAGDANGREHEFLFVRKGYAYARYRFVPVTGGVVHARLEPIAEDSPAAAPPEMLPMRPPAPFAPPPVARRPPPPPPGDASIEPDASEPGAPLDAAP